MLKVKTSVPTPSLPKKTITVTDVEIKDGKFMDEESDIVERVKEALSDCGADKFTIKITVVLADDGSEEL